MTTITHAGILPATADNQSFLLKRVQPALSGLMDGSLSTLAPIFAVVLATHHPLTAFYTGAATALGAGVSMAFSEGLSDTGDLTGRGSPVLRGAITGGGTFAGGIFHTLPFLIPGYGAAIGAAIAVVGALREVPAAAPAVQRGHQARRSRGYEGQRRPGHGRPAAGEDRRDQQDLLGPQAGLTLPRGRIQGRTT